VRDVAAAYAAGGAGPAMGVFGAAMGMTGGGGGNADDNAGGPTPAPDAETQAMMARMGANLEVFVGAEVPTFAEWAPDVEALRRSAARVVVAAGDASAGQPPHRAALALARLLGIEPVTFPGDHGGFGTEHRAFAARLHETLTASSARPA
jgi:hypothetical protein